MLSDAEIVIVGAGLSGSVMADRYARLLNKKVVVLEKRDHIGGNCYDYIDDYGVRISKYGAHLFHTNSERVWNYINEFDQWLRWEHQVVAYVDQKLVSVPVNITTVNRLLDLNIQTEEEMREWLNKNQIPYENPQNSKEMCHSLVGEELTEMLFRPYSFKQWERQLEELAPEVCARIPVRCDFDTRYFSDKYQALPGRGYTHFFERLLDHENIQVKLNVDYLDIREDTEKLFPNIKKLFFTGPIDHFYARLGFERLEYRSIRFEHESFENMNYYQPNSVVNYPGLDEKFTRIVEYKHFLHQTTPHTTIVKEYSAEAGPDADPYYPIPNERNLQLFEKYKKIADRDQEDDSLPYKVYFVGRLANYKYFNMDQAILNSLEMFDKIEQNNKEVKKPKKRLLFKRKKPKVN